MVEYTPTWLDPADVTDWLRSNSQPAGDVDRVCAMVEVYVQRCRPDMWAPPEVAGDPEVYLPDPEVYHGAVMYAARETRRRNSPAGIETFADGGATFVAKYDADIERALRTGQWTPPGIG